MDSAFCSIDPVPEMVRINEAQSSVALKNKKAGALDPRRVGSQGHLCSPRIFLTYTGHFSISPFPHIVKGPLVTNSEVHTCVAGRV